MARLLYKRMIFQRQESAVKLQTGMQLCNLYLSVIILIDVPSVYCELWIYMYVFVKSISLRMILLLLCDKIFNDN